jgi:hypothetical protein
MSARTNMMVDLTSKLTAPDSDFTVTVHDTTFPAEAFSQDEAEVFNSQFNQLIASVNSSTLSNILVNRQDVIANAAAYAKQELDGKVFGGINAGDNEVGFSMLRPGHIRADPANGNAVNDWEYQPGSTGWSDWIGDGSSNNYQVNEDQVSVVLAFVDQDPGTSAISGLNIDQWGRNMDMLPHDLNGLRVRDNDTEVQVKELPTMIARDGNDIYARLRYDSDVERQPRLYGITFGLGSFLNTEDY